MTPPRLSVDGDRLWGRLMALAGIGALPAGGVDRQALTAGEIEAWRLVIGWGRAIGMTPATDAAGNLFLTLPGTDPAALPLLAGSHLDTQPTGGKFDGAFGVLAALEAAETLHRAGLRLARDLIVVAWMNEEGSRFAPGMMGSAAFAGLRSLGQTRTVADAAGITVGAALDTLHAAFPDIARKPFGFPFAAFVEPHIEQARELQDTGTVIGIVTGIQGKTTFRVRIDGAEGHAGTVPPAARRDALASFARIAARLHDSVGTIDDAVRFTIGRIVAEPNAPSVIPARVVFSVDLRHPGNAVRDAAGLAIEAACRELAPPCTVTVERLVDAPSNDFDPGIGASIAASAQARGLPALPLLSAAGHDARHLAAVGPTAMIFIPCRDGVSHAEHEWAEPSHVTAGADVLLDTLLALGMTP
ncbi:Zn-dependent hydrolase [Methylobrevis pamukkalensis]|uniref:N-carbamoyl-L-amino acid hydrolase n=1 Tax=Methylobrevis pamukkalensis TaxID=1439726 RepID=A0A1E3H694_9HYPH|nr:Zn-dependent hydrolase [Methylobrevis pamukkalensis]ODN71833.1 N-carbamoyl-L-amino acid hydrolase [Methylobrevis pamukkalensis]